MDSTIPVPRVPGPPISAPAQARTPAPVVPAPPSVTADSPTAEFFDQAAEATPPSMLGAFYGALRGVNRVLFRSGEPGEPVAATPGAFKFSVIGDYGGGKWPQDRVARTIAKGNPDLILTTGDNVYYNGTESEFQEKWDPPQWFGDLRRNFPVRPSLGNHDVRLEPDGAPYFKRFPELGGARYYSFEDRGVHFVALDTNESLAPGTPQHTWLERDLAKSKQDWNVLYFHHPLFEGQIGNRDATNRANVMPLVAKYGVDLILSGHEHNYQRTKPLNDNGTLEIITGGGGKSLHPFFNRVPEWNAYRDVDFGHVEVEVAKDRLVGRYVVGDGQVRDTWTIPNRTPYRPNAVADAAVGASTAASAG